MPRKPRKMSKKRTVMKVNKIDCFGIFHAGVPHKEECFNRWEKSLREHWPTDAELISAWEACIKLCENDTNEHWAINAYKTPKYPVLREHYFKIRSRERIKYDKKMVEFFNIKHSLVMHENKRLPAELKKPYLEDIKKAKRRMKQLKKETALLEKELKKEKKA